MLKKVRLEYEKRKKAEKMDGGSGWLTQRWKQAFIQTMMTHHRRKQAFIQTMMTHHRRTTRRYTTFSHRTPHTIFEPHPGPHTSPSCPDHQSFVESFHHLLSWPQLASTGPGESGGGAVRAQSTMHARKE